MFNLVFLDHQIVLSFVFICNFLWLQPLLKPYKFFLPTQSKSHPSALAHAPTAHLCNINLFLSFVTLILAILSSSLCLQKSPPSPTTTTATAAVSRLQKPEAAWYSVLSLWLKQQVGLTRNQGLASTPPPLCQSWLLIPS